MKKIFLFLISYIFCSVSIAAPKQLTCEQKQHTKVEFILETDDFSKELPELEVTLIADYKITGDLRKYVEPILGKTFRTPYKVTPTTLQLQYPSFQNPGKSSITYGTLNVKRKDLSYSLGNSEEEGKCTITDYVANNAI